MKQHKFDWKDGWWAELWKFGRYSMVGVATNLAGYTLFLVLIWQGVSAVLASALCYFFGVTASYFLNRRLTFRSNRSHAGALPRFVAAYGVGLLVTILAMALLVPYLGPMVAQLVTIFLAAVSIYGTLLLTKF
jgi:putative flippase GtrA